MVSQTPSDQPGRFPTTQWSRVILAGDPDAPLAKESLAELCNAYWYPLYAYIRRRGYDPEQAKDLTQDFFARALEKGLFAEADPARGRFRSFLRTVCAHFLANRRDWEHARKRGGGIDDIRGAQRPVALDQARPEPAAQHAGGPRQQHRPGILHAFTLAVPTRPRQVVLPFCICFPKR